MTKKQNNVSPSLSTASDKTVNASELPQKAMNNRQRAKPHNTKETRPAAAETGGPKLIIKNGATDCRRSETALSKIIDERMNMNSHNGDMYAFANSTQTLVKAVQFNKNGSTLYKMHTNSPVDWPPYDGKSSVLEGSQAKQFIEKIGLPKEILRK
jgi:hypothetical protein